MLKPQWWVDCKPLADEAIKVVPPIAVNFCTSLKAGVNGSAPGLESFVSRQNSPKPTGIDGWRISKTGAFRVSSGGDIVVQPTSYVSMAKNKM